jgi:4-hydroxy-3-methylbut-2-enyl diphosphate reductase
MKVIKAKNYGFCYGVKKAVDTALLQEEGTCILGPLVHNGQIMDLLKKKKINVIDNIDDADHSKKILIRAHGEPNHIHAKAKEKGLQIIDCTCPNVKKIQDLALKLERDGEKVIIFGEQNHPEVKSITQNLINSSYVIRNKDQIKEVENIGKVSLLSQTTMEEDEFNKIALLLKSKNKEVSIYNTICDATKLRQTSAVEVARTVDMMIVIGGLISSNTRRLANVCSKIIETKHIETAKEIDDSWFAGKKTVGVTAGASTPDFIIEKVIEKIEKI